MCRWTRRTFLPAPRCGFGGNNAEQENSETEEHQRSKYAGGNAPWLGTHPPEVGANKRNAQPDRRRADERLCDKHRDPLPRNPDEARPAGHTAQPGHHRRTPLRQDDQCECANFAVTRLKSGSRDEHAFGIPNASIWIESTASAAFCTSWNASTLTPVAPGKLVEVVSWRMRLRELSANCVAAPTAFKRFASACHSRRRSKYQSAVGTTMATRIAPIDPIACTQAACTC